MSFSGLTTGIASNRRRFHAVRLRISEVLFDGGVLSFVIWDESR